MDFPAREATAKKGDNGKVVVIGGSPTMHGAPILAALGALAADVDLVQLFLPEKHAAVARTFHTNFIVDEFSRKHFSHSDAERIAEIATEWADAVVIGCGFLEDDYNAVETFLAAYQGRVVVDGGALFRPTIELVEQRPGTILTPHAGEFHRLTGMNATEENIKKITKHYGLTILTKGKEDIIISGEEVYYNKTGCPQMAVGGTGDALAGICGGLLARGIEPFVAAKSAAKKWGEVGEVLAKERRVLSAEAMLKRLMI